MCLADDKQQQVHRQAGPAQIRMLRAKPVLCTKPKMGDFTPSMEDLETGVQEMQEGCLNLTELMDSLSDEVQQSGNIQAPVEEEEEMKVEDFSVQDEEEGEEQGESEPTEKQGKGHFLWAKASRKILAYGAIAHPHPTTLPPMPPPMLEEMNQKAKEGLGLGLAVRAGMNGNLEFATIPDKKGIYYYFVSPSMKQLRKNPLSSPLFAVTALIIGGLWETIWLFLLTTPYAMLSKTQYNCQLKLTGLTTKTWRLKTGLWICAMLRAFIRF